MSVVSTKRRARRGLALLGAVFLVAACGQADSADTPARIPLATAQDSTLYAMGHGLSAQLNLRGLFTADEVAIINQGFTDAVLGDGNFDLESQLMAMNQMLKERIDARSSQLQAEGDAFVAEQGQAEGAVTTETGLVYIEQQAGTGATPAVGDSIAVHYEGRFTDGTVFDSSQRRGVPIRFRLGGGVIAGWQEGLQLMKAGGKAQLVIPAKLAYGERGKPPIPPNVPLVFDVELVEVVK